MFALRYCSPVRLLESVHYLRHAVNKMQRISSVLRVLTFIKVLLHLSLRDTTIASRSTIKAQPDEILLLLR